MRMHVLAAGLASVVASLPSSAAVLAFWDFNDGYDVADGTVQIVHTASLGAGTLYQQRADSDGNGKGGVAFVAAANGINVIDGKAMAWDDVSKSGENDAEFFLAVDTSGYEGITVSFDLKGNADAGVLSYDLKISTTVLGDVTNPTDITGTIKDFAGGLSTSVLNNAPVTTSGDGFVRIDLDLSPVPGVNDQAVLNLRFDDWKENDAMSIDNLLVIGTAIPEPSFGVLGLGALLVLGRRRR